MKKQTIYLRCVQRKWYCSLLLHMMLVMILLGSTAGGAKPTGPLWSHVFLIAGPVLEDLAEVTSWPQLTAVACISCVESGDHGHMCSLPCPEDVSSGMLLLVITTKANVPASGMPQTLSPCFISFLFPVILSRHVFCFFDWGFFGGIHAVSLLALHYRASSPESVLDPLGSTSQPHAKQMCTPLCSLCFLRGVNIVSQRPAAWAECRREPRVQKSMSPSTKHRARWSLLVCPK